MSATHCLAGFHQDNQKVNTPGWKVSVRCQYRRASATIYIHEHGTLATGGTFQSLDRVVSDKTVKTKGESKQGEQSSHTDTLGCHSNTPPLHKHLQVLDINWRILRTSNVLLLCPQCRLFDRMSLVRKNSSTSAISSLFMGELSELPDLKNNTIHTKKTCTCTVVFPDRMVGGRGLGGAYGHTNITSFLHHSYMHISTVFPRNLTAP